MSRSSSIETITTGMEAVTGSALSERSTVQPSIPGMSTSRLIASGRWERASRSASSPVPAVMTLKPSFTRPRTMRSRVARSSSTTRTVGVTETAAARRLRRLAVSIASDEAPAGSSGRPPGESAR